MPGFSCPSFGFIIRDVVEHQEVDDVRGIRTREATHFHDAVYDPCVAKVRRIRARIGEHVVLIDSRRYIVGFPPMLTAGIVQQPETFVADDIDAGVEWVSVDLEA